MKTLACALLLLAGLGAAIAAPPKSSVAVDPAGVLRWTASGKEVALFGVNYTAPFAHAFRAHQRLGITPEKAIDADVYHFARLGFDAYRVHVWDREVSDAQGNVVQNEHLRAFDYLLAALKKRGIKIILTPLQFGNAGHPEPGVPLAGFTSKYGKQGSLEIRESWPLQERYLAQFVSHVNPYTGLAYKDDPDILAFEICNEPGHFEYAPTVEYINSMVLAIRGTGSTQPIFYNMSHGIPVAQAYLDANVQGGTFQWYPANLVAGHEQRGNFLPYVDDYPIPFAANPKFQRKAKIVYEFDAADIGRAYIYPAIARTFRKAGMQFAAQFAYDPLYIAPVNTEYQTHYLNLAYAPQKALGMKIAGEAFRRIPLHHDYGPYPGNMQFAGVRVSYAEDLAELATDDKYFYSNGTPTKPPAPKKLAELAGYGNSPVVRYPGQGAYFLDRLERGVWRLEVMPDAIWVRDPFEKPSPKKEVVRIAWNEWPMTIDLVDLGTNFRAAGLNDGNAFDGQADGKTLAVRPGVYLLTNAGLTRTAVTARWNHESRWKNLTLGEFVAPAASLDKTYVLHQPIVEATAAHNLRIAATVAAPGPVNKVVLVAYPPPPPDSANANVAPAQRVQPGGDNGAGTGRRDTGGARVFPMTHTGGLAYSVDLPGDVLIPGSLRYEIAVQGPHGYTTFPSGLEGYPTDWDFTGDPWQTRIVPAQAPILLFDAAADSHRITADHRDVRYDIVPSDRPGTSALEVIARDLAQGEHDHSLRFFFREKIEGRTPDLKNVRGLAFYGESATGQPCTVQLALITSDGIAYGALVTVAAREGTYSVPVAALKQVRAPNIPHGYPVFIPFWSSVATPVPLDLERVESVMLSIGPGLAASDYAVPQGIRIERVWLD
ncbi:MAG TPA: hypothetical protein VE046_03310 [Steroidobacteraceae bacterium]|nr:hypothetical protein [Steroidobacteraceae bacterium]